MSSFELNSSFKPSGDQEQAIGKLLKSLEAGNKHQGLLGVTGSGKTFTMANLIARMNRPTLVISHNKTLAAQLHSELKSFFPNNAVDYYVSYFDYYQPEAYIASSDTYIEKDSAINDELDRLSLNAMNSLMTRRDVIVVASVSCIYGLSTPEDYRNLTLRIREGDIMDRDVFLRQLVGIYALSGETMELAITLVTIHAGCAIIFWPLSFVLPNALRAANDVKFTMVVSILSMACWRLGFSYLLCVRMGWGAVGVWMAMVIDWTCRVTCFVLRFRSGAWKTKYQA